MRQHEAVVQRRAPADRRAALRLAPEPGDQRAQQQLLGETHARVGRHFERAEFDEAEPPRRAVGRIELVDADFGAMGVAGDVGQQVAEQAIDEPERRRGLARLRQIGERDFEFVELIVARFVEPRRLAGRPDEQAGEQIGQRGMALPIEDEAAEQVGPAQERRICRLGAAEHDMIAAAGAGMAPVGHEFVDAEPRLARVLIDRGRRLHRLAPCARRDGY